MCRHTACALHTFCIVAELEKTRSNYEKVKHQFQIKARPMPLNNCGAIVLGIACITVAAADSGMQQAWHSRRMGL